MVDSRTRSPFASSVVLRVPGAQAVDVTRHRPWGGAGRLFDLYRPPDARGPLPAVVFMTGFADPGFRTIAGRAFEDTAPFSSRARLGAPPRDPDGAGGRDDCPAPTARDGPSSGPLQPNRGPATPPCRPRPLRCRYGADPGDSANVTMVSVAMTVTYCLPFTA